MRRRNASSCQQFTPWNFFHYPAYSVIGRLSGVAVGPNGNVLALNRGYHPVLEFKADGSFVRTWGEGSRMFEGPTPSASTVSMANCQSCRKRRLNDPSLP